MDLAVCWSVQANDGFSGGRFTASGFTHQPQALAAGNIQIDAVQGFDVGDFALQDTTQNRVVLFKAFYLQYLLHFDI
jgi:hypothetical protein